MFVGGCSLEAIAAVFDPRHDRANPEEDLLEALASLVNKSLLRQRPDAPEHGRLYMLETIREYALEQLAASGEAGEVRRLHALYYVALAEEFKAKTLGPDQLAWLDRLEQEHDNLRAALNWAASTGNLEIWARLASSLWWFWLMRGYISEGRRWLDSLLVRGQSLPPVLKGQALNGAGRLAVRQGDYATAEVMLQESLAIKRALSDKTGEMDVLDNLGLAAIYQDDLASAQSYFEQSLPGWRSLGNKQGMITALNRLGLTMRYKNDFARAETLYEECLALAREVHSTYYVSAALHNLGHVEHHRGNDARAHALLVESLLIARQLGDRPSIAVSLVDVAGVWAAQGQPERAARLFGASQVLRDYLQAIMYPAQRRAYERDLALAASQLDKEKWEAAWAQGRSMAFEDAFALAVEDLPSRPLLPSSADDYNLTERELEVLRLLVAGLTYAQIAGQLTVSFHTVHAHLRSIYGKLGVTSRNQATRFATEHHLV